MKTLIAAAVLLFASTAFAQLPIYNGQPIRSQYPNEYGSYYYQPNYYDNYGYYPQSGTIFRQNVGNMDFYYGTGAFRGFRGTSINFGNGMSSFRYRQRYGW